MNKQKMGALAMALSAVLLVAGCGQKAAGGAPELPVNTYKITVGDTKVASEFTGTVVARNKVPVRAKVTGYVVEKYVHGGQTVTQGQPLYRIDARAYDSALAAAKAGAAQANVAAENAQVDLRRYEVLAQNDAIAKQVLDAQRAKAQQSEAAYQASQAQVQIAQDNVSDTIVRAPFSGTLSMDDVDLGTFVAAGQTPLVTVQSTDPVLVEFSMTENDYLNLVNHSKKEGLASLDNLQLKLSDGTVYSHVGHVVEVSKAVDSGSGKITLKAEFPNPEHILLPGMFGTVMTTGDVLKNAILVPTKSIIQVLDKYFVMVVGDDGTIRQVPIKQGPTAGAFTVVTGELKANEQVLVNGLTKAKPGMKVKATVITKSALEKGQ